jgi:competence protein ComEC
MFLRKFINLKNMLYEFYKHSPAFHFSLFFLVGQTLFFYPPFFFLTPFLLLFSKKRLALAAVLIGYAYCSLLCPSIDLKNPLVGDAVFKIHEIKEHPSSFQPLLVYEGTLRCFQTAEKTYHRLPCRLYLPLNKKRPLATHDYALSSISILSSQTPHYPLTIKLTKSSNWTPLQTRKTQAEWRFQFKKRVKSWVKNHFSQKPVQTLISSLLTGEKKSRLQTFQFGEVGLQHLLAISGFHFAILTLFLAFFLKRLLSQKWTALVLIFLLSLYFFYMGQSPSISRAWIAVLVFLGGTLLERKSSSLNALGVALFMSLALDPFVLLNVGFQLSFGATLSILLFYPPFEKTLQTCFPKRSLSVLKTLPVIDQIGSLFSSYLRKAIALNLSVSIFTCPILLCHFHKFSLTSLFYNLFFPTLFTLLVALLLLGLCLPFLLPIVENYARFLLHLIEYAPKRLIFFFHLSSFPPFLALFISILLFLWGVYLYSLFSYRSYDLKIRGFSLRDF